MLPELPSDPLSHVIRLIAAIDLATASSQGDVRSNVVVQELVETVRLWIASQALLGLPVPRVGA